MMVLSEISDLETIRCRKSVDIVIDVKPGLVQ